MNGSTGSLVRSLENANYNVLGVRGRNFFGHRLLLLEFSDGEFVVLAQLRKRIFPNVDKAAFRLAVRRLKPKQKVLCGKQIRDINSHLRYVDSHVTIDESYQLILIPFSSAHALYELLESQSRLKHSVESSLSLSDKHTSWTQYVLDSAHMSITDDTRSRHDVRSRDGYTETIGDSALGHAVSRRHLESVRDREHYIRSARPRLNTKGYADVMGLEQTQRKHPITLHEHNVWRNNTEIKEPELDMASINSCWRKCVRNQSKRKLTAGVDRKSTSDKGKRRHTLERSDLGRRGSIRDNIATLWPDFEVNPKTNKPMAVPEPVYRSTSVAETTQHQSDLSAPCSMLDQDFFPRPLEVIYDSQLSPNLQISNNEIVHEMQSPSPKRKLSVQRRRQETPQTLSCLPCPRKGTLKSKFTRRKSSDAKTESTVDCSYDVTDRRHTKCQLPTHFENDLETKHNGRNRKCSTLENYNEKKCKTTAATNQRKCNTTGATNQRRCNTTAATNQRQCSTTAATNQRQCKTTPATNHRKYNTLESPWLGKCNTLETTHWINRSNLGKLPLKECNPSVLPDRSSTSNFIPVASTPLQKTFSGQESSGRIFLHDSSIVHGSFRNRNRKRRGRSMGSVVNQTEVLGDVVNRSRNFTGDSKYRNGKPATLSSTRSNTGLAYCPENITNYCTQPPVLETLKATSLAHNVAALNAVCSPSMDGRERFGCSCTCRCTVRQSSSRNRCKSVDNIWHLPQSIIIESDYSLRCLATPSENKSKRRSVETPSYMYSVGDEADSPTVDGLTRRVETHFGIDDSHVEETHLVRSKEYVL